MHANSSKRTTVRLRSGREHSLKKRHPWVYSGALSELKNTIEDGDLIDVLSDSGEYLGTGHFGIEGISVRLLSFSPIEDENEFIFASLKRAMELRRSLGLIDNPATTAYRLVNAEGDNLPGLVIDVYNSTAVVQFHSAGMLAWQDKIVSALCRLLGERLTSVFDKSPILPGQEALEGLPPEKRRYLLGEGKRAVIVENGIRFSVDWERGQKTGFYLDQRENRSLLERYVRGKRVLNAFSYTGGFSLFAMHGGAEFVASVDSSAAVIEELRRNIELNSFSTPHIETVADCLEYLKELHDHFDVVVLDPPAFVKYQGALTGGIRGYESINYHVLRQLKPGSLLFTFSCSQFVSREMFRDIVLKSALRAGKDVNVLYELRQAPCHPVSLFHPEGEYLTGLLLAIQE